MMLLLLGPSCAKVILVLLVVTLVASSCIAVDCKAFVVVSAIICACSQALALLNAHSSLGLFLFQHDSNLYHFPQQ